MPTWNGDLQKLRYLYIASSFSVGLDLESIHMIVHAGKQEPLGLVVFSGVIHFSCARHLVAHGGFVREIDVWARIFERVTVVSPMSTDPAPTDAIPYSGSNIAHLPLGSLRETGGIKKVLLLIEGIRWFWNVQRIVKPTDCVMARGPDSVGFLGVLVKRNWCVRRFGKYADQWQSYPGEPVGYRLQKLFYSSKRFGGPVQIYGKPDPTRPHLVPFFTSSLSTNEWTEIGRTYKRHLKGKSTSLMLAGRLEHAKGADILLYATKYLLEEGHDIAVEIVGDGKQRKPLLALSESLGISNRVVFRGWVGRRELFDCYARADIFVHPSRWEGFGKVLIEAMAFSLPIVATDVGVSRTILSPPLCGLIVNPNSADELKRALGRMIDDPEGARVMGSLGRIRSKEWVLENLEVRYRGFLRSNLGIDC